MICKTILSACLLALVFLSNASGQGVDLPQSWSQPVNKYHQPLRLGAKDTITIGANRFCSRLYADAYLTYEKGRFVSQDSGFISYSSGRGGDLLSPVLKFDCGYAFSNSYPDSGMIADLRTRQIFDANNNLLSSITQSYNTSTHSYENWVQIVYTYDANNRMLTQTKQEWSDSANVWLNDMLFTYTFDDEDNLTSKTYASWDNSKWKNVNKGVYRYRSVNKVSIFTLQYQDTADAWQAGQQTTYSYDANNNETQSLEQEWDRVTNTWVNSTLITLVYDNKLLGVLSYQKWNSGRKEWTNAFKDIYRNYTGANAQTIIEETWDTNALAWTNQTELLYTYNGYDQPTTITWLTWIANAAAGSWQFTDDSYTRHLYYENFMLSPKDVSEPGGHCQHLSGACK